MLYYDRTEVFKRININKTGASKERSLSLSVFFG